MRKLALLAVCVGAFLAMPGIAAADTAQGKLTGSGTIAPGGPTFDVHPQDPVIDGGTSYVGLENDKSGNCNGDSGTMLIRGDVFPVACAHYVASSRDNGHPKMRFAFQGFGDDYQGVRITDNGQSGDTVAFSPAFLTFAQARAWVNKGAIGGAGGSWVFQTLTSADYTVTAAQ